MKNKSTTRRRFLGHAALGTSSFAAGIASAHVPALWAKTRRDLSVTPDLVRFDSQIEPLVRLIEETPRENCLEKIAEKLRKGMSYRQLLTAMYLAGIRNLVPGPVGGGLHSVFLVHSVHQMSLDVPTSDRFHPIFWSIDYLKKDLDKEIGGQARFGKLKEINDSNLPSESKAWGEFHAAMAEFDGERAERAMVVLVRHRGASEIMEQFWRYGAQDYRAIGHKAVYVAGAWRVLQTIGWQHAEPVMRSLAIAMAGYEKNRRQSGFTMEEQSHRENWEHARRSTDDLPATWTAQKSDPKFVAELLSIVRTTNFSEASKFTIANLTSGKIQAGGVWDAIHLAAGEIVMRQTTIRPIHAVTSTNGLHYAFRNSASDDHRLYILLQGLGWMTHFISFLQSLNAPFPLKKIDRLSGLRLPDEADQAAAAILDAVNRNPEKAGRLSFEYGKRFSKNQQLLDSARQLIYLKGDVNSKGDEAHRFKFFASAEEDIRLISPEWRPHYLAATSYYMHGSGMRNSSLAEKTRELLK